MIPYFSVKSRLIWAMLLTLQLSLAPAAFAQNWPAKPLTIVVGFAAGGPTDLVARTVARALGDELGQSVIVENRPGAGSTVAAASVANGAQDGYTMLLVVPGLTGSETLFPARKYDLARDFVHVSLVGTSPNWLLTSAEGGFKTIQDVVKLAQANPAKYSYAHGGSGGISHLTAEWLKSIKGLDIVQVPYRGNGPALIDLAAGRVDLIFDQPISSESFVKSGKIRPLAVTSATRIPGYPNVPTMAESGFPDFVVEVWYGLSFRAGTPESVVNRVNAALAKVLVKQDVKLSLQRSGVTAIASTPKEFDARVRSEIERWRSVIVKNGITLQ